MTSALDWITDGGGAFPMPGATRFKRIRPKPSTPSPYNPDRTIQTGETEELEFLGALASSSSRRVPDGLDTGVESVAYLTVNDPGIDIQVNDTIIPMPDDGRRWTVTGFPSSDPNAFTGWRPTREIRLGEWKGT